MRVELVLLVKMCTCYEWRFYDCGRAEKRRYFGARCDGRVEIGAGVSLCRTVARRVAGAVSAVAHVSTGAGGHAAFVRFEAEHVKVSSGRGGRGDGGRGLGQQVRVVMMVMVMVMMRMMERPDAGLEGTALHDHIGFGLLLVLLVLVLLRDTYGTSVTPITIIINSAGAVIVVGSGDVVVVRGTIGNGSAVFWINYWARWWRFRRFDQLDVVERVPIVRRRRPRAGGQGHADHAPGQCQA